MSPIIDNIELVQALQFPTSAKLDQISSAFAHNLARLSPVRAIASTTDSLQQSMNLQ